MVVIVAAVWVDLRALAEALGLTFWAHFECLKDSAFLTSERLYIISFVLYS